jgi:hypothetical protein
LNVWFSTELCLKINNYRQAGIVYYGDGSMLTDAMIEKINDNYNDCTWNCHIIWL